MSIYGFMKKEEKRHFKRLLSLEINSFLKRIYSSMKRSAPLKRPHFSAENIILKHASPASTKHYEFRLNKRSDVMKGDVGEVIVATNGLKEPIFRKQRALFIACEWYIYHAFSNHPNPKYFQSIKGQNQYWDMLKKLFRAKNSHELRDQSVRYVIEEIGEHRLAHLSGDGWHVSISGLKDHNNEIADLLGTSEHTFRKIIKKQHKKFTPDMLKGEEDLVRKELDEINYLIDHIETVLEEKKDERLERHLEHLKSYSASLGRIRGNLHNWYVNDKEEHKLLKKGLIGHSNIKHLVDAESEAETIDINKVYILFNHFEKEKINILNDIESVSGRAV